VAFPKVAFRRPPTAVDKISIILSTYNKIKLRGKKIRINMIWHLCVQFEKDDGLMQV